MQALINALCRYTTAIILKFPLVTYKNWIESGTKLAKPLSQCKTSSYLPHIKPSNMKTRKNKTLSKLDLQIYLELHSSQKLWYKSISSVFVKLRHTGP